jgi:hypothetical protein
MRSYPRSPVAFTAFIAIALGLSACGPSDDLRQSCPEIKADVKHEVVAFAKAHPPANARISVLAYVRAVSGLAAFDPEELETPLWIPPAVPTSQPAPDSTRLTAKPDTLSAVQVVSDRQYIAHVSIYDSGNRLVRSSVQAFGLHGELQNDVRKVPTGFVSYLAWDGRETTGVLAADGIYLWKITFDFTGGEEYSATIKTGLSNRFCEG